MATGRVLSYYKGWVYMAEEPVGDTSTWIAIRASFPNETPTQAVEACMAMSDPELRMLTVGAALQLREAALARERVDPSTRTVRLPEGREADSIERMDRGEEPPTTRRRLQGSTAYASTDVPPAPPVPAGDASALPATEALPEASALRLPGAAEHAPSGAEAEPEGESRADD